MPVDAAGERHGRGGKISPDQVRAPCGFLCGRRLGTGACFDDGDARRHRRGHGSEALTVEPPASDLASRLGDEHGHRMLRVCGKGTKTVLIPLPPAVGRAIDRAAGKRVRGPILINSRGARMDRHAATRRRLAKAAGVPITRPHPHMLRHTFVTTMLDAGVDTRDVQIADRHADPRTTMRYDRARKNLGRHPNYILAAYMAAGT